MSKSWSYTNQNSLTPLLLPVPMLPFHSLTFGSSFFTMLSHTFLRRALSCSMDKCFFLVPGGGASWENLAKTLVWWWWWRGDSSEESSSSRRLFFFTFFNLATKERHAYKDVFSPSRGAMLLSFIKPINIPKEFTNLKKKIGHSFCSHEKKKRLKLKTQCFWTLHCERFIIKHRWPQMTVTA